jgi:hypothetical protein
MQGAFVFLNTGATEDAAWRRFAAAQKPEDICWRGTYCATRAHGAKALSTPWRAGASSG